MQKGKLAHQEHDATKAEYIQAESVFELSTIRHKGISIGGSTIRLDTF